MTWQLWLALATTVPALVIAGLLFGAICYRRLQRLRYLRARYLAGPRHIKHSRCRCYFCARQRGQEWVELKA